MLRPSRSDHGFNQHDPDESSESLSGNEPDPQPVGGAADEVVGALRRIAQTGSRRVAAEIALLLGANGFTIIRTGNGYSEAEIVDSTMSGSSAELILEAARDGGGALARRSFDSILPFSWTFADGHTLAGKRYDVLFRRSAAEGDLYCFMEAGNTAAPPQLDRLLMAQGLVQPVFEHHLRENSQDDSDHNCISSRERECLRWCAEGKTSEEIAIILSLSAHTVNNYLTSATRKLHAVNRMHAIANAFRKGVLPLNSRALP